MEKYLDADLRVLEWRVKGLWARLGYTAGLTVLVWMQTQSILVLPWAAMTTALTVLDTWLSARLLHHPHNRGRRLAAIPGRIASGASFPSVVLLCLLDQTELGVVSAFLCACAITLNTAIMARGSRLNLVCLLGPAGLTLVALPLISTAMGHRLPPLGAATLAMGSLAYLGFTLLLSRTLLKEADVRHAIMVELERERDHARDARHDLADERARWRTLFHQSPLPQIIFDASRLHQRLLEIDGEDTPGQRLLSHIRATEDAIGLLQFTEANEAAHRLYGVERFESSIPAFHFRESFLTGFGAALDELDANGIFPPFPAQLVRADGRVAEVEVHIRTLPQTQPPWSTCMVSLVDLTDLRAAVEAAEAASRSKSEFLAVMGHEIRTPLNGVLGMAQAMARDSLEPRQRERLEVIQQSGEALLAILNDLLDLSKIEAGKLELEAAPFQLEDLARGAYAAFTGAANAKGLSFGLTIEPEALGAYIGDSARLRQVLYNLISNAVKFTSTGGVQVKIGRGDEGVTFEVRDTGVGIAADRIERLFNKFVQGDSSTTRQFGGTGLGLAICRELCQAMGGRITVESRLGEGSCFTATLPLAEAAAPPATQEPDEAPEQSTSLRVLAAEDNHINQLVLRTLLEQFGVTPVVVANGLQAVDAWRERDFDIILMDVQMPGMDGPTAARSIRQIERETGRARTPILALTANAMTHQVDAYRAAGMDGVVAKPLQIGELLTAINAAIADAPTPEPDEASTDV